MDNRNLKVNSLLNTVKTLMSLIFPLITFPYVSRILLPENIGKVNFGLSVVGYFSLLATLGITTYAIRECAGVRNNQDELNRIASQIFSINVCTTLFAYICLFVLLYFSATLKSYRELILIQSIVMFFTVIGTDWINTAMEDFFYITIRTIAVQIISLCLMFVFVHTPDDYIKYAMIMVFSTSGANILNAFYVRKYCHIKFVFNMEWRKHFKEIMSLFVMLVAQIIFSNADVTMLGFMRGDYEVGLYSTAYKVTYIVSQIVSSLAWVMMPRLSAYFAEENYFQINELLRKILGIFMLVGIPCTIGLMMLSRETVLIVGGKAYEDAACSLIFLIGAFFFSLVGGSFLGNMVLLPSKRENVYMVICVVACLFKLLSNYWFIPYGGLNAAAFTTMLSSVLIMVLLLYTKDRRIVIRNIGSLVKSPCIGGIMIALFCWCLKNTSFGLFHMTALSVFGSVCIYTVCVLFMKNEVAEELIEMMRQKILRYRHE